MEVTPAWAYCGRTKRERGALHHSSCERSELSSAFNGSYFHYIYFSSTVVL